MQTGLQFFADVAVRHRLYHHRAAVLRHCSYVFGGVERFDTALDVGGGTGVLSFYMAARGGRDVTCLEPEGDGSTAGVTSTFEAARAELGFQDRVRLVRATIQDYDPGERRFDVVVIANAINHLDEPSCIVLKSDSAARQSYVALFRKFYDLLRPDGQLIFTDCSRYNFFSLLGLTNPMMRSIEWHKHQSPYLWRALAREAGFVAPQIQWTSYSRLGMAGRCLMGNPLVNYFTLSSFRVAVRRPRD
jgi:SAM-dependent methyltransferase